MQFNKMVAVIAIFGLAGQANAAVTVAANDVTVTEAAPTQGVVIMNSNTNTNANTSAAASSAQPTTVVEASPVSESKADLMRKARQSEEVKTEQKIVEKLEESRLKEEQQRAERLFGNKLEAPAAAATATAVATPNGAAATATAVVAEDPKKDDQKDEVKPTQVTIEKVEIVQPKEEPEAVSSMKMEDAQEDEKRDKFFVGGILAAPNYDASNVKSNYGLGVSVGMNLQTNWVIEGTFLYSNHSVDTYWQSPLYRDLDQYDFSVGAKYYILSGKLKPYVGASIAYIYRKYQDRIMDGYYWYYNPTTTEEDSNSFNGGLTVGADYEVSKNFLIGGGLDYSFNLTNRQDFRSQYALPSGVKPLEEIDYTLIKVNAKMTF